MRRLIIGLLSTLIILTGCSSSKSIQDVYKENSAYMYIADATGLDWSNVIAYDDFDFDGNDWFMPISPDRVYFPFLPGGEKNIGLYYVFENDELSMIVYLEDGKVTGDAISKYAPGLNEGYDAFLKEFSFKNEDLEQFFTKLYNEEPKRILNKWSEEYQEFKIANAPKMGVPIVKNSTDFDTETTIVSAGFQDEVRSDSTNMFASYFPPKEDSKYFVVEFNIKNNGGKNISQSDFSPEYGSDLVNKFIFKDKFEYTPQWLDSENSAMSQYFIINPLRNRKVYLVTSVPNEVTDEKPLVKFVINGEQFEINLND